MNLKALTFDIIGTVFDAYDGLAQGVGPLNAKYGIGVQDAAFASGSLNGYGEGVESVLSGQGWTPPDTILQDATGALLPIQQLGAGAPHAIQDFFDLWRALPPWRDVAAGMQALHKNYALAILSNMGIATGTALRSHAGLPFDKVLSAKTVKTYKPNPAVYQMAISTLNVSPSEILMVAAHNYDLNAAKGQGFRTAFLSRPNELGPAGSPGNHPDPSFDFNATSLLDLAQQLGADFVTTPDDCLAIEPNSVQVRQIAGSWKVVSGSDQLFDSGRRKRTPIGPRMLSYTTASIGCALSGAQSTDDVFHRQRPCPVGRDGGRGYRRLRSGGDRGPAIGWKLDRHGRHVAHARLRQQQIERAACRHHHQALRLHAPVLRGPSERSDDVFPGVMRPRRAVNFFRTIAAPAEKLESAIKREQAMSALPALRDLHKLNAFFRAARVRASRRRRRICGQAPPSSASTSAILSAISGFRYCGVRHMACR